MNSFLDNVFVKKEKRRRRAYELQDELYEFLEKSATEYSVSISDILNVCIRDLIESNNLKIYENDKNNTYPAHKFSIDESNIKGLNELKESTMVTLTGLVSMAIRNVMLKEGWENGEQKEEE